MGQAAVSAAGCEYRYDCVSQQTDFGSPAIGALISGGKVGPACQGVEGNGDTAGRGVDFYLEEYVGYNHRVVLYMDGFGRKMPKLFYTGGTIST